MSVTYGGDKITFDDGSTISSGYTHFRNRIINGAMEIDQRNAGAAVTSHATFPVDRFRMLTTAGGAISGQRVADAPTGTPFNFSTRITVTTAATPSGGVTGKNQNIEGYNVADFKMGTSDASTFTISFWVKSSVTGTYGMSLMNNAANRFYLTTYTINSANTWEYKTITVPGDTGGTWLIDNNGGIRVDFDLGSQSSNRGSTTNSWQTSATYFQGPSGTINLLSTLNSTWQITGLQVERGSFATTFERRPYTTELQLCQRYYYKLKGTAGGQYFAASFNESTTQANGTVFFPVTMRTNPTALEQTGTAGDYSVGHGTTATTCSSVPSFGAALDGTARVAFITSGGLTAGQGSALRVQTSSAFLAWSAEL